MHQPAPRNPESNPVPPAAPGLALADLGLTLLLGVLVLVALPWLSLAGVEVPRWVTYFAVHLWVPLWLIGGLVAGGPLLSDRQPWLKKSLRFGRAQFIEYGGGFYGAVALTCFLWLEWARVQEEDWGGFLYDPSWHGVVRQLIDFSIASVMNGIFAVAWPGFLGKVFDSGNAWPAIAVGYAWFEGARWLVRHLPRRAMR
jgi:hypothetical protein